MAVSTTINRIEYIADNVTTVFPYTFLITAANQLEVYTIIISTGVATLETLDVDYSVSGVGVAAGGDVTFLLDAPASGRRVLIIRKVPFTQETDYVENDPFPADTHEAALDKLTMAIQQLHEVDQRSIKIPETSSANDFEIPDPDLASNQGKVLRIKDDGSGIEGMEVSETDFSNPLTTHGDMLVRGSVVNSRLPVGFVGQVPHSTVSTPLKMYHAFPVSIASGSGGMLVAEVGSNALTVSLKRFSSGGVGVSPTTADPVIVPHRNTMLTESSYGYLELPTDRTVTLSAGSTLGFTTGEKGRIYIGIVYTGSDVALTISRKGDWPEDELVTTVAEGGAGGADSADTLYAAAVHSNVVWRLIGYLEITTAATAGNWDTAPTKIQMAGPGVHRTGDVIQRKYTQSGAVDTGTTTIPLDDTIPQNTEGDEYLTRAITPRSALNTLRIETLLNITNSALVNQTAALFQDTTADALAAGFSTIYVAGNPTQLTLRHEMVAGTVTETTFKLRAGGSSAGTTTVNGVAAARSFGGVMSSYISVEEIFA